MIGSNIATNTATHYDNGDIFDRCRNGAVNPCKMGMLNDDEKWCEIKILCMIFSSREKSAPKG